MAYLDNLIPLFTDPAWAKHANASPSADGKTLTLNATGVDQNSNFTVNIEPLARLTLSITQTGRASVYPVRNGSTDVSMQLLSLNPGTPASGEFTVPNNVTQIRIFVSNSTLGNGVFTFSNPILQRKLPDASTKNLVVNGGFENLAGWISAGAGFQHSTDGSKSRSGMGAVMGVGWSGFYNQEILNPIPGMWYEFAGYCKGDTPSDTTAKLLLRFFRGGTLIAEYAPVISVTSNGWTQFSVKGMCPINQGITRAVVYTTGDVIAPNTKVWFDDVTFTVALPNPPTKNLVPLFNDPAWVKHANAVVASDGKTLTLNATVNGQHSFVPITVQPGMLYDISLTGNVFVTPTKPGGAGMGYGWGQGKIRFYTGAQTSIWLYVSNNVAGAGVFTASDLKLVPVMPHDVDGMDGALADLWEASSSSGALPTVSMSNGILSIAGSGVPNGHAIRRGLKVKDFDIQFKMRLNFTDSAGGFSFRLRDALNYYLVAVRTNATPSPKLEILRYVNGTSTFISSAAGLSVPNNTWAWVRVRAVGNSLKAKIWLVGDSEPQAWAIDVIDTAHQGEGRVAFRCSGTSTADYDDLKITPIFPNPTTNLVVNDDFSQGVTGWTPHANAQIVDGKLVLNATAPWQATSQNITVTPSTTYVLSGDVTGVNGRIDIWFVEINSGLSGRVDPVTKTLEFNVPASVRTVTVICQNSAAGVFTFDNIRLVPKLP